MHLVHTNRNSTKTDITLVGKHLTFSRIIDSKLATINKLIKEDMSVPTLTTIITNATTFDNDTFLLASSMVLPEDASTIPTP